MTKLITLYDTTLRDGTQGEQVNLSAEDKLRIAHKLDEFGIQYVEGGWPGSNPKDARFFEMARKTTFQTLFLRKTINGIRDQLQRLRLEALDRNDHRPIPVHQDRERYDLHTVAVEHLQLRIQDHVVVHLGRIFLDLGKHPGRWRITRDPHKFEGPLRKEIVYLI